MSKIVWLASYPKSGNTWFRIFLANYLSDSDRPIDINAIDVSISASSRIHFDQMAGVDSADLTHQEIARYRPAVYRYAAQQAKTPLYIKIHDAFTNNGYGEPIIPLDATHGVIYFIRNVLDVTVSLAYHLNISMQQAVHQISRFDVVVEGRIDALCEQLRQNYFSWSKHILSWVDASKLPLLILRYEDMLQQPHRSFEQAIKFIGLPFDSDQFDKALTFSDFAELQRQEQARGFHEWHAGESPFFRRGRTGGWRDELTQPQIDFLLGSHGQVMRRFNYLSPDSGLLV